MSHFFEIHLMVNLTFLRIRIRRKNDKKSFVPDERLLNFGRFKAELILAIFICHFYQTQEGLK